MLGAKRFLYTTSYIWLANQIQYCSNFSKASKHSIVDSTSVSAASSRPTAVMNPLASPNDTFQYEAGSSSVAFVTTPDSKTARKLAEGIIEHKLAACVNIIPQIQSIYMWEGKINEDNEYLMMIKTKTSRLEELTKWVRDNHPYSVAEVITLPIQQGNALYMKWLADTVPDKN